ncbi:MAC/Perforin domain-containing protein [Hygrophoropsis aurantiaca]|uniref:MAC/Perforin domain-containing protein n=1 Tax=Hygrophoropsis aurantiaca TaxID=72124 RepID=A0ACB7ZUR5_9AGAM|nr:MAC/Perforin domain-containing protein [Hygrophoropsis aurantiaca]
MSDTSKPPFDFPKDYIPLLWTLGSTYNTLTGKYADPRSVEQQVIDWSKSENRSQDFGGKQYSVPLMVNLNNFVTSDYKIASGKSTEDYSKDLNVKAGLEAGYAGFTGSASADYSENQKENLANTFTRISYNVTHYTLSLPNPNNIRKLLKESFVQDLDSMDPVELYNQYGTHFLRSITVGGRAVFLSSTDSRKYSSEVSIEAAATVSAQYGVASGKLDMSTKDSEARDSFKENSETSVHTQGGNPKFGNENFLKDPGAWAESITDWPHFVDFGSGSGLIGLWELVLTPVRRTTLRTAYKLFASGNGNQLSLPGPYIRVTPGTLIREGAVPLHATEDKWDKALCYPAATDPWYPLGFGPITVSELVPGALSPVKWKEAFTAGFPGMENIATLKFWRAEPPTPDYVVLGSVGTVVTIYAPFQISVEPFQTLFPGLGPELPDIAKQVRAVHKSALTKAKSLDVFFDLGDAKKIYAVDKMFLLAGRGLHLDDLYAFDPAKVKVIK